MLPKITFAQKPHAEKLVKVLREAPQMFRDCRSVWVKLVPILAAEMLNTIRTQGANAGEHWAPLKIATLQRRRRRGSSSRAELIDTQRLLRSLGPGAVSQVTATRMRFGPDQRYQFVQHYGSRKRGLPARRYIVWTPRMREAASEFMRQHLQQVCDNLANKAGAT